MKHDLFIAIVLYLTILFTGPSQSIKTGVGISLSRQFFLDSKNTIVDQVLFILKDLQIPAISFLNYDYSNIHFSKLDIQRENVHINILEDSIAVSI